MEVSIMETKTIEECGCEFTSVWDKFGNNMCVLTKCRCKKHYEEQLVAEWYDHEGHHCIIREPEEVDGLIPLEVETKD